MLQTRGEFGIKGLEVGNLKYYDHFKQENKARKDTDALIQMSALDLLMEPSE